MVLCNGVSYAKIYARLPLQLDNSLNKHFRSSASKTVSLQNPKQSSSAGQKFVRVVTDIDDTIKSSGKLTEYLGKYIHTNVLYLKGA
jgi:hypothetical protein